MARKLRVSISRDECILCGACWSECPEVFEESADDGESQIVAAYRLDDDPGVGIVPDSLEDCVRAAADVCPVEIIAVEELE